MKLHVRQISILLTALLFVWAGYSAPAATKKAVPKKPAPVAKQPAKSPAASAKKAPAPAARKTTSYAAKKQPAMASKTANVKYTGPQRNSRYRKGTQRPATPRYYAQGEPTQDRYREIQQALAKRGYLKSEPSGKWDPDSQNAMRQFQQDQKLDPSGKLDSLSLIALGLGPKRTESAQARPQ